MEDPVRLIIWATHRSCSSILLKSFNNLPDSQMIFQMYSPAYFWGPDRVSKSTSPYKDAKETELDGDGLLKNQGSGFNGSICSFDWVKRQLEANYPGKRFIIAKEMAQRLNNRFNDLPRGYRHVFLVRKPYKMFPSLKKLVMEVLELENGVEMSLEDFALDQLPPDRFPPGMDYKEIFDLWQYIKENNLEPDPVIIDSDDLISNPAQVLSALCGKVGLPYSDSLLSWDEGTECVDGWVVNSTLKDRIENAAIFHNFQNSTCFIKPEVVSKETLSPDLQRCVEFSMPYYSKMYDQRLKY